MFTSNDRGTKEKRRVLRNNVTEAEKILWKKLKRKQLGLQFRRQFGIGSYILDFYCPEKKLAVELDGGFHRKRKEYDEDRTEYLNSLNISVMRFWNQEIVDDVDAVVEKIKKKLGILRPLSRIHDISL
ncbi:endonuclease domain-containing protein [Candidatus Collierbacteria bacterium]|nr:endonuclease domain-containing protein [Candidatus Collierbacteria bacterium]